MQVPSSVAINDFLAGVNEAVATANAAKRYQVKQKGRRYYVVDTHKHDEIVGITRTSLTNLKCGLNETQAKALADICNHVEALES